MKAELSPQLSTDALPPEYYSVANGDIWLYFIQQKSGGPVNIGGTKNVKRRLSDLQAACPDELRLMACVRARPSMEMDLHALLESIRIRAKWFETTELTQNLMRTARQTGASGVSKIIREYCFMPAR